VTALRIGFVGVGNMGDPMVRRLAAAGHSLHVYDTSQAARDRISAVPGVTVTKDVTGAADRADVVILMLPDSDAVEAVLLGGGLLEQVAPSTLLVDMGSSEPVRTRELAATAARREVILLDAPVSGGVRGAQSGRLTIMAGGPETAVARVRPVLELLGSKMVHAGTVVGAGHAVKALNNLMSGAHLLVSSEAILAGRAFGLDPAVMLEIVNGSSGKSGSTETKWPRYILPASFDSGFGLRLMVKDMKVALQLEQATGIPAPLSQAAVDAWSSAASALPPDADHTEIVRWLEHEGDR
jgi:3-hydroxyisobutyrate dehydrogenase